MEEPALVEPTNLGWEVCLPKKMLLRLPLFPIRSFRMGKHLGRKKHFVLEDKSGMWSRARK